jgi:hypothetical protein
MFPPREGSVKAAGADLIGVVLDDSERFMDSFLSLLTHHSGLLLRVTFDPSYIAIPAALFP